MAGQLKELRYCPCGVRLARDNRGALCAACRKVVTGCVVRRPLVPRSFWQAPELGEALEEWHFGRIVRAYRLHEFHPEPIAQATVANWFDLTQAQLSRIENGPPVTDLAKLIPWACALSIPEELLWFKLPKRKVVPPAPVTVGLTMPAPADVQKAAPDVRAESDLERDDMRRRTVLQGLLAGTGTILSSAMLGDLLQIEQLRREVDRLLDGSEIGEATIERWEAVADEHSQRWLETPPEQRLIAVAGDLAELQHFLERRHTTEHRMALTRASSELAVLVGHCFHKMGDHRNAQAWFRTAMLAAGEAQDRRLSGLALAKSAMDGLFHDAPERTLARLAKAQALLGRSATSWRAQALVVQARALATLNRGDEAQWCITDAETTFQAMPASALADPVFGYTEQQFFFTVGNAYTRMGKVKEAEAMHRQALGLYRATEFTGAALTQLDQARCMVRQGDASSACEHAMRTITAVPSEHQGLIAHDGRRFLAQLPEASRTEAPVRELRELLRAIPT